MSLCGNHAKANTEVRTYEQETTQEVSFKNTPKRMKGKREKPVTSLGKLRLNPTRLLWEMSTMNPRIIPAEWGAWNIYPQVPLAPCWGSPPGNIKSTGLLHCSVQAEKAPGAVGELKGNGGDMEWGAMQLLQKVACGLRLLCLPYKSSWPHFKMKKPNKCQVSRKERVKQESCC